MVTLINADALAIPLSSWTVNMIATSPPYWRQRIYQDGGEELAGQLGLEPIHDCLGWAQGLAPEPGCCFVCSLRLVGRQLYRVLRPDGVLWLNLGDSWAGTPGNGRGGEDGLGGGIPHRSGLTKAGPGLKTKDLIGIPWRVALALQGDGWILRQEVIWEKTNAIPDPAPDRPWRAHEHIFLLAKSARYWWDNEKWNKARSVWHFPSRPWPGGHYATWPKSVAEHMIRVSCPPGGLVLDPFAGSGTTLEAARNLGRRAIGLDLSWDYLNQEAKDRLGIRALETFSRGEPAAVDHEPVTFGLFAEV